MEEPKSNKRFVAISLFLALTLLLAPAFMPGSTSKAAAQALSEVRVGYIPLISFSPLFIGIEKGYFKEEGLKLKLFRFASAGKMMAPLATADLDVAAGSASAGLFNAIALGKDFKIVADKGQSRKGYGFTPLIVRKDLLDTGRVKSVKDLKGRKVSIFAKGTATEYILGRMAKEVGLSLKDFNITALSPPKQLMAFKGKAIDAAVTAEPWAARAEKRGLASILRTPDQVEALKEYQVAMIIYSGKFIREKRDLAQKFMNAYVKGVKYHNKKGMKDKEIIDILVKHTKVDADTIAASIPFWLDNEAMIHVKSLERMQDWLLENGYMKERVPMEKVLDLSFLKK